MHFGAVVVLPQFGCSWVWAASLAVPRYKTRPELQIAHGQRAESLLGLRYASKQSKAPPLSLSWLISWGPG